MLFSFVGVVSLFVFVWVGGVVQRDASLVDRFWGVAFMVIAGVQLGLHGVSPRGLAAALAVSLWGVRLSIYLTVRNWGHGEDRRYVAMRSRTGPRFWWVSLFSIYLVQAILATIVSLPVQTAVRDGGSLGVIEIVGLVLFGCGFVFEVVADTQLALFLRSADKDRVMDHGVWGWSRHPNYFGETALWWGLGLVGARGSWWALLGPAVITFMLLRVSGVAMLEKTIGKRRPGYAEYVRRTSAFVPLPPKR